MTKDSLISNKEEDSCTARKNKLMKILKKKVRRCKTLSVPAKKINKRKRDMKQKVQKKKELRQWHRSHGLTHRGFVRKKTKVFFNELDPGAGFPNDPVFHGVPHLCMRRAEVDSANWQSLLEVEQELKELIKQKIIKVDTHKFGANKGVNVGLTVRVGFPCGDKEAGMSGSVQWSDIVKGRPLLRNKIINTFKGLIEERFGKLTWYERLKKITKKLNEDSNETRTIPDLPITGIWFTCNPKKEHSHCYRNACGSTFLLTTSDVEGGELLGMYPNGNLFKHHVKPGEIVAGKWATNAHCNNGLSKEKKEKRTSWTVYLDRRVFSKKYIYNKPKGFLNQIKL